MSQENVEVVRRASEAFERGDRAAWLEQYDGQVVVQQTEPIPDARTYYGREGLIQVVSVGLRSLPIW